MLWVSNILPGQSRRIARCTSSHELSIQHKYVLSWLALLFSPLNVLARDATSAAFNLYKISYCHMNKRNTHYHNRESQDMWFLSPSMAVR